MDERPDSPRPLRADERLLLDTLVRDCGPRLLGYVRRTFGKRFDPEDIVAETFCRAAANIETLRGCERQDLYLLTVARNLCRDKLRRRRESPAGESLANRPADLPPPDQPASEAEQRRDLLRAVAALPEAQREVVTLRLSTGLKFEEIAELLGAPLGTILSRMHSAVRRLKEQMGYVHER